SGTDAPTATALLPDTHVAVVRADRIVAGMEEAFALVRTERGDMPRALNMISGPSRTGDIEQTIVLGAHGPFRVHILLLA
ncbi:MAG: LUD domain-containing protein, partial [Betaproteobacteria bacterium]|nr:LUD domain-containing protein [Betaproteobacteria bacterium]